uniref:Uncharacterized protein n=1 Tax=Rhizophora mucronata TaxID=61149 RepID=A0A2P2IH70_RHIMU
MVISLNELNVLHDIFVVFFILIYQFLPSGSCCIQLSVLLSC